MLMSLVSLGCQLKPAGWLTSGRRQPASLPISPGWVNPFREREGVPKRRAAEVMSPSQSPGSGWSVAVSRLQPT